MIRLLLLPFITLLLGYVYSPGGQEFESEQIAYPEHLSGTFTGGFGEETCHSCHFDNDVNAKQGTLTVKGIDANVAKEGDELLIQVMVEREDLGRAGFQLTARFEDGSQAGQFHIQGNERLVETRSAPDSLQYIQHSKEGSNPNHADKNSWDITWSPPESSSKQIIFHITANAANGDQSEFGDYIFTKEIKLHLEKEG